MKGCFTIIHKMIFPVLLILSIISCGKHNGELTIDGSIEYQIIDGWGINHFIEWDWEGPDKRYPILEREVMDQLKKDLLITDIHIYQGSLYEEENDDNDPFHYNWKRYDYYFQKHHEVFERLKSIQEAGLRFTLKGGNHKPSWMEDANGNFNSNIPGIYDELAEYWAAFMIYAKRKYDLAVPLIVIQQEPSWKNNCNFTPEELTESIKVVGARLRQEGFGTKILAPDDSNALTTLNMCKTILRDHEAKKYISNIAFHAYDGISHRKGPDAAINAMRDLANNNIVKNSGLSIWMTEWVLWYDKRMRDYVDTLKFSLDFAKMIYNSHKYANSSNFVIWSTTYDWGYDADNNGIMENEGIFGPGTDNGKLKLKKYGHAFTQYTKYILPGSKRIETVLSGRSNVFATAYKNANTSTISIVLINQNEKPVTITCYIKHFPKLEKLKVIRTSQQENSIELEPITLNKNTFSTILLGSSITTLTGQFLSN